MRKLLMLLLTLTLLSSTAFTQILLDGDDADWLAEPLLIEAVDNVDGYFPMEVGAAVTDIVDVKEVKAKFVGNVLYFFIRFWGGPAWPNMADQGEYEGVPINRSRGYYHLLLDLDNDITTGWNSHYYEAHYTPVGYLASQGIENTDPLGADTYLMWGSTYWKTAPHPDSGGIKNSGVRQVEYYAADVSEIVSETDAGADYDIFWNEVSKPDSAKGLAWNGTLPVMESDDETLVDGRYYWMGHAWGFDFLEVGIELTMIQQYWENKGMTYFNAGDVIGLAAMIETPADDWGVDLTPRGEISCPEIPVRPNSIAFDGDESDWAAQPVLVNAVDNVDGYFPLEVGAAVTDIVDVKEVKAFINDSEDAIYWFVRFWGGPAWPNMADQGEYEGTPINRSRGYYHLLLDVDNDATTGWDSHFYEAHYTPVGYLASQGMENADPIGADVYLMWGATYWKTPPHPDSGGIKNTGVRQVEYYAADVSEIESETDAGADYDIYWNEVTDPDSAYGLKHDGMLRVMESDDATLVDDMVYFNAHAWGYDFIEVGQALGPVKKYWMNKFGTEILKPGDVVGIAAMIETPMDDWGVDLTPRGELGVTGPAPYVVPKDTMIKIARASNPPAIDGKLDAIWYNATERREYKLQAGAEQIFSWHDGALSWRALYDDTYLYMYVRVIDDTLIRDGSGNYQDDGVEIWLDGDNSKGTSYDGVNDFGFSLAYDPVTVVEPIKATGMGLAADFSGVMQGSMLTNEGYDVEVALPLALIGVNPTAGYQFGLEVDYNDDDNGGASRETKIKYFSWQDDSWTNPSTMGTVELSARSVVAELGIHQIDEAPVIDGMMDEMWLDLPLITSNNYPSVSGGTSKLDGGWKDASYTFRIAWDATNLYMYIAVNDETWVRDSGTSWPNDDAIELYIDADNSKGATYDGVNDWGFRWCYNEATVVEETAVSGMGPDRDFSFIQKEAILTTEGLALEIAIPLDTIGVNAEVGQLIGFELDFDDDDDGTSRDSKVKYFTTIDESWQNPSTLGTAQLLGAEITKVEEEVAVVNEYRLEQNFPNPFNPTTTINYSLKENSDVQIIIFNTLGRKVRTLVDKNEAAGHYSVRWDGKNDIGNFVATGLYFYKIKAGSFIETKKMILMK